MPDFRIEDVQYKLALYLYVCVPVCLINGEKVIIMSQQEMDYSEMNRDRSAPAYGRYEGTPRSNMYGEKLSAHAISTAATAGQRLALAIVSLAMLMVLIFGLTVFAAAANAPNWAVIPILFIIILFSAVAVIINIVFNIKSGS